MGHTTQVRGMASILRMRTAISAEQWQPNSASTTCGNTENFLSVYLKTFFPSSSYGNNRERMEELETAVDLPTFVFSQLSHSSKLPSTVFPIAKI